MPTFTGHLPSCHYTTLAILLLGLGMASPSAADTRNLAGWRLILDNDAFAPNDDDIDYTGGVSLAYASASNDKARAKPPKISLAPVIHVIERGLCRVNDPKSHPVFYAVEGGSAIFTPDDITSSDPQQDDRPYASLLYFPTTRQTLSANHRQAVNETFTLGVLGLPLTPELQNGIHKLLDVKIANGWNNQISAGGEPTLRYGISRQTQHGQQRSRSGIDYDFSSALKGNLGYLTDIGWGMSGRIGRITSPWWTHNPLLEDYAERGNAHVARKAGHHQFYLWGGVFARARAYNALLQGQFRNSVVSYSRSELNTLIADAWVGLEYVFAGGIRLGYSWHAQTSEVKHGKGNRNQTWGSVGIAGTF